MEGASGNPKLQVTVVANTAQGFVTCGQPRQPFPMPVCGVFWQDHVEVSGCVGYLTSRALIGANRS